VRSVIAVDVGGTSIKAARVAESGEVLDRHRVPTPVSAGAGAVVATIREVAAWLHDVDVVAAGVVVPGIVDPAAGIARYAANLGWRDEPLAALLQSDLELPVRIDNDVRGAGLAERSVGRARGVPDCLIVMLGTGIAAVLVAGGQPVWGGAGMAGEVGHVCVVPNGEPCPCGQRGCLERYASGAAVARRYGALTRTAVPAEEVVARLGVDPAAAQVWAEATDALATVLAQCTLVLDPSLVVLAGGLAIAGEALRAPVAAALAARLTWRKAPEVAMSTLGADVGVYGAALLAWSAAPLAG
jgi:glucokinase